MKKTSRKKSIFSKILIPILIMVFVQLGILYCMFFFGGITKRMKNDAFAFFEQKVSSRGNMLETDMIGRWSNLSDSVMSIKEKTGEFLAENNKTLADLTFQNNLSEELLAELSDDVIYLMRRNAVTGAFLVLSGDNSEQKDGIYFSDSNPENNPSDNSDIMVLRSPSSVNKKLSIAMDSSWRPYFDFREKTQEEKNFYSAPIYAASKGLSAVGGTELSISDLGYWSTAFNINTLSKAGSSDIITYSVPVCAEDGTPYAVLGIELEINYFSSKINSSELGFGAKSGYIVAMRENNEKVEDKSGEYSVAAISGAYLKSELSPKDKIKIESLDSEDGFYRIANDDFSDEIYLNLYDISLYNSNTPFENNEWVLIGSVEKKNLFSVSNQFNKLLFTLLIISIPIGLAGVFVVTKIVSSPILKLSRRIKSTNVNPKVTLEKIGISEIDDLLDSIEFFSKRAENSAYRLSKILEMTGVNIGAFEYDESDSVFCTATLLNMLEIEGALSDGNGENVVETSCFEKILSDLYSQTDDAYSEMPNSDGTNDICLFKGKYMNKWLRIRRVSNSNGVLGVVTDVTQEILERKRIEHDRDYDSLTNIYNRRAFRQGIDELFLEKDKLKTAAMIMIDIDNLKYVNDTYGHDYGDEYLCATANVFSRFSGEGFLLARQSGDEFNIFIYGYETKDEIRDLVDEIKVNMKNEVIRMPDDSVIQVRASAGIAWYPDDSDDFVELLRYADFAMYFVKKKHKGDFTEFDLESYNKNAYLLNCREELNTIIEQSLISYHFQPIVDAKTGEIFAYEALMRPKTANIKNPEELLMLARSHSKLAQIEKLTMFNAMEAFSKLSDFQKSKKVFINSIANQILSDNDVMRFEEKYEEYLENLVIEVTETEDTDVDITRHKLRIISGWGAQIALDDYGSGYNGETSMLKLIPEFIKIDLYFVRDIHMDNNKLEMVRNFISFAHDRGIKVIAEGVETAEEMHTLISEGVDYLQGFYFSRPSDSPPDNIADEIKKNIRWTAGTIVVE